MMGVRVVGHAALRDYWSRQFATINSNVEPLNLTKESDGSITEKIESPRGQHYRCGVGLVGGDRVFASSS
jgi:hypothetical protein